MRRYYEAYDARYRAVHAMGLQWSSDEPTPIVPEVLERYRVSPGTPALEIGCGEGRDARAVLARGFDLLATDASEEAVAHCRAAMPDFAGRFRTLDCLRDDLPARYGFIYAVAVVHMLVPDADRRRFYRFIRDHLTEDGLALICTMGDGVREMQTDVRDAFALREREHPAGRLRVAATSCRMVSFATFERELAENGLLLIEKGLAASPPDFDRLMVAVARRDPNPIC